MRKNIITPEITIEKAPLQGEGSVIELLDVDTVDKTIRVYRSDFIDLLDGAWFTSPDKILEFTFDDEQEFFEASEEEVEERVKKEVEDEFFSDDAPYPFSSFIEEYGIEVKGYDIRDFEIKFEGEITQFDGIKEEVQDYLNS